MNNTFGERFLKELENEAVSTRKCLERLPENLFAWKPHERSMQLGYLALLVADIPKWVSTMIAVGEINFATWDGKYDEDSFKKVTERFDENMEGAKTALKDLTDEKLEQASFTLKSGDAVLLNDPLHKAIREAINHWVHHRGQLTVYMRLNDIPVPSIYGPSADEKTF